MRERRAKRGTIKVFVVKTVWSGVAGSPYYTTLNFAGTPDLAEAAVVHDRVADMWAEFDTWIHSGNVWTVQPEVNFLDVATGEVTETFIVPEVSGNGADAADQLPRATQGLITWLTGTFVGGRQIKGRTFLPGPCETSNDAAGRPLAAYKDNVAVIGTRLVVQPNPLVVYSPTHLTAPAVSGYTVGAEWAVLRSRRD